ncbi:MAG: hypothetical protein QX196_10510 [Methylococcaceae bacterium]
MPRLKLLVRFSVPLDAWFNGPLIDKVRDALLRKTIDPGDLFNLSFLEYRLLDK